MTDRWNPGFVVNANLFALEATSLFDTMPGVPIIEGGSTFYINQFLKPPKKYVDIPEATIV
jgi:tRNA A37 N6-isopentenylltransferase MiaA